MLTTPDADFNVALQDSLQSIHECLPKPLRPTSGPGQFITFEAETWDGSRVLLADVDPATALWKEDFIARRSNRDHKSRFLISVGGEYVIKVYPRRKTKAKARATSKAENKAIAQDFVASTRSDVEKVDHMISDVRSFPAVGF